MVYYSQFLVPFLFYFFHSHVFLLRSLILQLFIHSPLLFEYAQGTVSTFAGSGISGSTGDSGAATSAALQGPRGMAVDASGTVHSTQGLSSIHSCLLFC